MTRFFFQRTGLFLALALLPALLPAPARASAVPITVLKDGLQEVPFVEQPAESVIAAYPFLRPLIDEVRSMELHAAKDTSYVGTSTFSTALVKDRDLKANFVFLYIDGPLNCSKTGCAFFAFANEGAGYKLFTPLFAREPVKLLKKGRDVALILRGTRGHAKWPFDNHVFRYGGMYAGDETTLAPPPETKRKPPAPMSRPLQ